MLIPTAADLFDTEIRTITQQASEMLRSFFWPSSGMYSTKKNKNTTLANLYAL